MVQINRSEIPAWTTGKSYVVYAVDFYKFYGDLRDLVIATWAENRFDHQGFLNWMEFFVFADDHDWNLFKIANGITTYKTVEITDDYIIRDHW